MNCAYCGKEINPGNYVKEDENYFCNNLCKKIYKNNVLPEANKKYNNLVVNVSGIIFHLDLPNFKKNKIEVKGSTSGFVKLLKNGEKLKPKEKKLNGKRAYEVIDDYGEINSIILKMIPFDAVPLLEVNGESILIAPSMKWYSRIWAALPVIMLFWNGVLGALIGAYAAYINSILFRRISSNVGKHLIVGVNNLFALSLVFIIAVFFSLFLYN